MEKISSSSSCNLISYLISSSRLSYNFTTSSSNCSSTEDARMLLLKDYATREFNAFLWISLITVTALLLEKLYKLLRLWTKARAIPGPPCSSIFGHSNFGCREKFIELLSELHDNYGSVLKLWLGPTQLLVSIKDPELIRDVLLKAEDKLPFTGKAFRLAFGRSNLFFCSYDQAQKRRESLALQLNEKLLPRASVIPDHVIHRITERIDESMRKGHVDCKLISQHMAFTLMGTTLFGDAFLAWSKAASYEDLLMTIAKDATFWASYRITPVWEREFWRYQSLCSNLKFLTQDIVQLCRKNCKLFHHVDQNFNDEIVKCGMKAASGIPPFGVVMQDNLFPREIDGHYNSREEPCGNIMGMMFHGCIATAGLLGNILERLVAYPELQDKIYSEIIGVRQRLAKDVQNVDQMPQLVATIYESARLLPTGPLLQRCSLKDDLILKNGVTIPAGAVLVVPVHLLQMDDASWGSDAGKFNPYRFLSKAGKDTDSMQDVSITEDAVDSTRSSLVLNDPNENAAFLPFGSGIRACVAQKFTIQGVATLLASVLERYEIRHQVKSENDPLSASREIVFVKRSG
ncbi:cytochrome P450 71A20-like isoform X2 [Mercurialis annua]|uniref:cytochrome P450 71A20-like isoform X2 n=1 Tax=Mercurialis annua TaxID=3986 RepID=UPI002160C91E|nr:cytochrome P450 71A20-like isoform X2 [Mercurialis annua]